MGAVQQRLGEAEGGVLGRGHRLFGRLPRPAGDPPRGHYLPSYQQEPSVLILFSFWQLQSSGKSDFLAPKSE